MQRIIILVSGRLRGIFPACRLLCNQLNHCGGGFLDRFGVTRSLLLAGHIRVHPPGKFHFIADPFTIDIGMSGAALVQAEQAVAMNLNQPFRHSGQADNQRVAQVEQRLKVGFPLPADYWPPCIRGWL
jgi:hypothetical protein